MAKKPISSFKKHIEKQLIYYSLIPWAVVTLALIVFATYDYYNQAERAKESINIINQEVDRLDNVVIGHFSERVSENIYDFIIENSSSQQMYEMYYSLLNKVNIDFQMALYDFDKNLVFTTHNALDENYYLSIINYYILSDTLLSEKDLYKRAYRIDSLSRNDNSYVIGKNIFNDDQEVFAQVLLFIDSNSLSRELSKLVQDNYMIIDRFDYVLASREYEHIDQLRRVNLETLTRDYRIVVRSDFNAQIRYLLIRQNNNFWSRYGFISYTLLIATFFIYVQMKSQIKKFNERNVNSIDQLVDGVKRIQTGDLKSKIELTDFDEFTILANQLNEMTTQLDRLIQSNYELSEISKDAQIKQLLAQFNPHFLFNSLETIRYLILEDQQKASDFVLRITKLLRYSIDSFDQNITLEQEIKYTKTYLSILAVRFRDKLTYDFNVQEEALGLIVPKLLLQPIIENSIKYGLNRQGYLNVVVSIKYQSNILVITVADNGGGMHPKQLQALVESLSQDKNESSSYGLYNISKRLKLKFNNQSEIIIKNIENGLEVTIQIEGL